MKTTQKSTVLDLTGAYYLRLEAAGLRPENLRVQYIDHAQAQIIGWELLAAAREAEKGK